MKRPKHSIASNGFNTRQSHFKSNCISIQIDCFCLISIFSFSILHGIFSSYELACEWILTWKSDRWSAKFSWKTLDFDWPRQIVWNRIFSPNIRFHTQFKMCKTSRSQSKRNHPALLIVRFYFFSRDFLKKCTIHLRELAHIWIRHFSVDFAKLEQSNASVHKEIEYPSIVVTLAPEKPSTEQYKYAEMLSDVFQRFDAICRSHDVCLLIEYLLMEINVLKPILIFFNAG